MGFDQQFLEKLRKYVIFSGFSGGSPPGLWHFCQVARNKRLVPKWSQGPQIVGPKIDQLVRHPTPQAENPRKNYVKLRKSKQAL